jgi:hypothetical protein
MFAWDNKLALGFTEFFIGVDKAWKPNDSDKCKFPDGNKI